MFILIRLRNARKTKKAKSKVNEIDMYDAPTAKPGKNHLHKNDITIMSTISKIKILRKTNSRQSNMNLEKDKNWDQRPRRS